MRVLITSIVLALLVGILLALSVRAYVDITRCSGCGDCVSVCPVDAINISKHRAIIDPEKCVGCGLCAQICPKQAIRMTKRK